MYRRSDSLVDDDWWLVVLAGSRDVDWVRVGGSVVLLWRTGRSLVGLLWWFLRFISRSAWLLGLRWTVRLWLWSWTVGRLRCTAGFVRGLHLRFVRRLTWWFVSRFAGRLVSRFGLRFIGRFTWGLVGGFALRLVRWFAWRFVRRFSLRFVRRFAWRFVRRFSLRFVSWLARRLVSWLARRFVSWLAWRWLVLWSSLW